MKLPWRTLPQLTGTSVSAAFATPPVATAQTYPTNLRIIKNIAPIKAIVRAPKIVQVNISMPGNTISALIFHAGQNIRAHLADIGGTAVVINTGFDNLRRFQSMIIGTILKCLNLYSITFMCSWISSSVHFPPGHQLRARVSTRGLFLRLRRPEPSARCPLNLAGFVFQE
jgi:hypothetical protein